MSYLDTVNEKKQTHAQTSKEQSDFMTMIRQFQAIQAATLASAGKPNIILTDQTDLADKINDMVKTFGEVVKSTDQSKLNSDQIAAIKELKSGLDSLKTTIANKKADNSDVVAAIRALKLDVAAPIVNVPAPIVTLQERAHKPIDFTPLQDTIKEYFKAPEDEKIDLDCYRAQDITDNGDTQYVGFVNPEGNWYIIENKVRENQLRYIFGDKGYAKAFKKAAQYEYMLLNEAINAITA